MITGRGLKFHPSGIIANNVMMT